MESASLQNWFPSENSHHRPLLQMQGTEEDVGGCPVHKTLPVHMPVGILHLSTFHMIHPLHPLTSSAEAPPHATSFQSIVLQLLHYHEWNEHNPMPVSGDKQKHPFKSAGTGIHTKNQHRLCMAANVHTAVSPISGGLSIVDNCSDECRENFCVGVSKKMEYDD
jgi:hypothetical protein